MVRQVAPGDALLRLFEQTDDARVLLGEDGSVVLVNQRLEQLLGWSREELVGQSKRTLVPEHLRDEYARLRELLLSTDSTDAVRLNLRASHRDGHEVPVRMTARLIHLGANRVISLILQPRNEEDIDTNFRELLEALLDGNVIVDGDGRIVMVNQQALEMFGYPEGELLDQPVEVLVPDAVRPAHVAQRTGFTGLARRHAMGQGTRVLGRRRDGSTFPVQVLLSSIGSDDDVLVSATIHDMSEVEALQSQNERLRAQFLATVSHELRTPLTTIMASAEMLVDDLAEDDGPVTRDQVEAYLDRIMRAAQRELALIDDLLALTSIEGEREPVGIGLADLGSVVEGAVAHVRDQADARGLAIRFIVPEAPVPVPANERWIARAVGCLLDNALKFTPSGGGVFVTLSAGEAAVLEVRDTGPGLPPGEEEMVFERLNRGTNAMRAEVQGAGLGLTIARGIVAAAGGTLVAVPSNSGACFRLSLPMASHAQGD
jgi:PAS domain S-box-containing protein